MKTVTITLTEQQVTALVGMLDAAVRACGIKAAKDAAKLVEKIEEAMSNG